MLLLTASLATLFLAAFTVVAHWFATAPLAEQTEDGFTIIWRNDRPDYRDVSCVWGACAA